MREVFLRDDQRRADDNRWLKSLFHHAALRAYFKKLLRPEETNVKFQEEVDLSKNDGHIIDTCPGKR